MKLKSAVRLGNCDCSIWKHENIHWNLFQFSPSEWTWETGLMGRKYKETGLESISFPFPL